MNNYHFLAIDGALNNFGLAIGGVVNGEIYIEKIELINSKKTIFPSSTKGDAMRGRFIVKVLHDYLSDINVVFAEIPIGSKSYRAAWSLGIALGIIVSINKPIIFVQPKDVKNMMGKNANKSTIIEWAVKTYPNLNWLRYGKKITRQNEHCADAIAIAHVGVRKLQYGTENYI